jgi:hypothetical protein
VGHYDLGLQEAEFWRMTPRAFMALVERLKVSRRWQLYCAALPASAIYNVHRKEGTDPITPEMLVGSDESESTGTRRLTAEEMALLFHGVMAPMLGGEVHEGSK